MVLYSNRDENHDQPKKEKRRDTWCFGNLSRDTLRELNSKVHAKASTVKPMRSERDMGPLLPFEELLNEACTYNSCKPEDERDSGEGKDCTLPDPRALLHVTSWKKAPVRRRSLLVENNKLGDFQAEYEDLFLKFATQMTVSEIQIDFLTRKLAEADLYLDEKPNLSHINRRTIHGDVTKSLRESEAIPVIKQLQEKINMLEMEKSSSQQNLDCVVELATEQNVCAMEKYEELYEDLLNAREEARIAREQLTSMESFRTVDMGTFDSILKLSEEVQQMTFEVQSTRNMAESFSLVTDELLQSLFAVSNLFFELKSLVYQSSVQLKSVICSHENLYDCMGHKVNELENEKLLLHNHSVDLQRQIQELSLHGQDSARALTEISEEHDLEKSKLLSHIQSLEKEISCLSSSTLAREKENLRKELEKTKTKLREAEFKLRNAIQEKTKLEGEKARADRELKKLHGQKAFLERDISKRKSLAGRRHDSVVDKSSNLLDPKGLKGLPGSFDQTLQDDYRKLEVLAFEMETTIASLEEELAAANEEKEVAVSRTESLASNLQALSEKLSLSNSELNTLQQDVSDLRLHLEESKSYNHELESSIKNFDEEKEELAMQLAEALLSMEEQKAVWSAKEKASVEAIEEKSRVYSTEIMLLSKEMSEVWNELASCREECKILRERLVCYEENAKLEKTCSLEKSLDNDRLREELRVADTHNKRSQENLQNQLLILTKERDKLMTQIEEQQSHDVEVESCAESCDAKVLMAKAEVEALTCQLSSLEAKLHNEEVVNNKEKAKLRMKLRGTQAKLEAFSVRYKEALEKMDLMNNKYEAAAAHFKAQLASYALEVLDLKKQIAALKSQMN